MTAPVPIFEPMYLNFSDLTSLHLWVGSTLAFSRLDPTCLQKGLHQLLLGWPVLGCRFTQTSQGKYVISGPINEIPFVTVERLQVHLKDLPSMYAEHNVSDKLPSNKVLPEYIPQLQPHLVLSGKEALFKVQLTQVQDGSVLGFSFSHGLSDYAGMGHVLMDLSRICRGEAISPRTDHKRLWLALEALRGAQRLPSTPVSDDKVIAELPSFGPPPTTYADCVATGKYALLGPSAEECAAGEYHHASVLHVPSVSIERLRNHVLTQAKREGVGTISANDIMSAILWLIREVANGNSLKQGLQKCFIIAVDLRKNGAAQQVVPKHYFGNAVGGSFCMPPGTASFNSATQPDGASQTQEQNSESESAVGRHFLRILARAAVAVRKGLEAFRADPHCLQMQAKAGLQYMQPEQVQALLASPDFVPVRDMALWVSSWINMPTDNIDFGSGKPKFVMGSLMPASSRTVNVTAGPDGDGMMCLIRLPREGLSKVQHSQLLKHIAPEARFITQST